MMKYYDGDFVKIYVKEAPLKVLDMMPSFALIKLFCFFNQVPFVVINENRIKKPMFEFPFVKFRGQYIKDFSEIVKTLKKRFLIPTYHRESEIIAMTNITNALFDKQKFDDEEYLRNAFKELPDNNFLKTKFEDIVDSVIVEKLNLGPLMELMNKNHDHDPFSQYFTLIQKLTEKRRFLFGKLITTADLTVYSQLYSLRDRDPESTQAIMLHQRYPMVVEYLDNLHRALEKLRKDKFYRLRC